MGSNGCTGRSSRMTGSKVMVVGAFNRWVVCLWESVEVFWLSQFLRKVGNKVIS